MQGFDGSVVHFHIPKAAGSTINHALCSIFPQNAQYSLEKNWPELTQMETMLKYIALPDQEKLRYKYVYGHVERPLLQSIKHPHFSFTFLRDPIERALSMYYFVKRYPSHHLHTMVKEQNMTLTDFFESRIWHELDNGMVRRLSGVMMDVPPGQCTSMHLQGALNTLISDISFFGFQETFDQSYFLLAKLLGLPHMLNYSVQNATSNRRTTTNLTPREREVLVRWNRFDIELHTIAKTIFAKKFAPLLTEFAQDIDRYVHAMQRMRQLKNIPQKKQAA